MTDEQAGSAEDVAKAELIIEWWTTQLDHRMNAHGDDLQTLTKGIARALAASQRAVMEEAIVLLKRRADHYTGTRDVSTVTRDIQFNEVMGCIETLERHQQAEAGR